MGGKEIVWGLWGLTFLLSSLIGDARILGALLPANDWATTDFPDGADEFDSGFQQDRMLRRKGHRAHRGSLATDEALICTDEFNSGSDEGGRRFLWVQSVISQQRD